MVIQIVYKIYLAMPLILTVLFIGIGAYKFFKHQNEFMKYIINGGIGIAALILGYIVLDVLMPLTIFSPELNILNVIGSVIIEFGMTTFMIVAIIRYDLGIKNRLYFLGIMPCMFLAVYLINMVLLPIAKL